MGQAPFHDYMLGTGSFAVAGELIDCLIFIEDPWWVWFSVYLNTSVFSFSTRNMMLQDAALIVSKTILPGVLPISSKDGWKQKLSKPRFISSFLPFTCGPPYTTSHY